VIASGLYDCVLGSRILGLSEYHTGYRAFSRRLLEQIDLEANSDDFVFDNQMLAQVLWLNYRIARQGP